MSEFALSDIGLPSLSSLPIPSDFSFIVNKRRFPFYRALAAILSPAVLGLLASDATAHEFTIEATGDDFLFQAILDLFSGRRLRITWATVHFYVQVSVQLQLNSLVDRCLAYLGDSLSTSTVFPILRTVMAAGVNSSDCISFIARHFEKLSVRDELQVLELDLLLDILKSPDLEVGSQQWLLFWIQNYISVHDDASQVLLEAVHFDELSGEDIITILESLDDSTTSSEILQRLKPFFIRVLKGVPASRPILFKAECTQRRELCGVFERLRRRYGGNPHELGIVQIGVPVGGLMAQDLVEYGERLNSHWKNSSRAGQNWITFDFKGRRLKLSAYTIRGCYCTDFRCRPKSWNLYGSDDANTWIRLDHQEFGKGSGMDRVYAMTTCQVTNEAAFRYIKWEQIENWDMTLFHIVHISAIEFFGTVYGGESRFETENAFTRI
jgi:hypothetical protein